MKKILLIFAVLILCVSLGAQSLVEVIPAPNYSYGLTHDGSNLWVGTSSGGNIHKLDDAGKTTTFMHIISAIGMCRPLTCCLTGD